MIWLTLEHAVVLLSSKFASAKCLADDVGLIKQKNLTVSNSTGNNRDQIKIGNYS